MPEQRRIDRQRRIAADEHGIAIGGRRQHLLDGDEAVGSCLVFDDHRLARELLQLAPEIARRGVGAAARTEGHDELDRLGRKALSRCLSHGGHADAEQAAAQQCRQQVSACLFQVCLLIRNCCRVFSCEPTLGRREINV